MKKKSITTNYIFNLIYQMLVLVVPFLITPYLTRVLGAVNLGIYSYTYSIATIFFLLAALGLNTYGQREIAYVQDDREKRSKLFFELVVIRVISTIISVLLLVIFALLVKEYRFYYLIFSLYVFANIFDITWLYQGMEDFKDVSIRNIFVKILYIISVFLFVKTKNDLGIYIFLFSFFTVVVNFSFWFRLRKIVSFVSFKNLDIKKHLKPVFLLFIPQVASLIYTVLDKTMLGIILTDISNVSFYEQASYIVKTILMLITTIGTVMISKMSYTFQKKDYSMLISYMHKIINFVWLFGCALLFGIVAVIKNFVPWFYGNEYLKVIEIVYYMSPIIIIIGLNNVIGIQYLIPTKQQNKYIVAVSLGALVNFILNLILINVIGVIGAVIASVAAELFILLLELYFVKDKIKFIDVIRPALKYLLFGLVMGAITYLVGNILGPCILGTCLQIMVGFVVYVLLLLVFKDKFIKENVLSYFKRSKKV